MKISFRGGYKYQTVNSPVKFQLRAFKSPTGHVTPFCEITKDGLLTIRSSYAWDGPSGPTVDTDNFMLGSLVHDCLYEMLRNGYLPHNQWHKADAELDRINQLCGMSRVRRWWVRKGLAMAGGRAALPKNKKPVRVLEYAV